MRNSDIPRHARVRYGHSGRLHRALLPAALGGMVAGSIWLATDAAAAPVPYNSGSTTDGSSYSAAPGPTSTDGASGGSYSSWRDGDGQYPYDGQYPNQQDPRSYDGQYPHDGLQRDHYDDNSQHDWQSGDQHYAPHPRVTASRPAAPPHPANPTPARTKSAATPKDPAAPPAVSPTAVNVAAAAVVPSHQGKQESARQAPATQAPQSSAAETIRLSGTHMSRQPPSAAHSNLAAADTARPTTDFVALYGAIGGAALAALLGMGGFALWRRRGAAA